MFLRNWLPDSRISFIPEECPCGMCLFQTLDFTTFYARIRMSAISVLTEKKLSEIAVWFMVFMKVLPGLSETLQDMLNEFARNANKS